MQMSDRVEVITKYVVGRSGILGVQLHTESISLGLSYDFPVLNYNVGNTGALEVGFEWRKPVKTRAQKISAKRKKAALEKQKAQAKKPVPDKTKPAVVSAVVSTPKQDSVLAATQKQNELIEKTTVTPTAIAKAGDLKQEPLVIEKVTLHFPFNFNSAELDEPTEDFLKDLTLSLQEDENLKVKIQGHTDNIGSDKFNLRLSQKRADAVKQYLIKSGINPERLQSEGMGMHQPLNENLTDAERAKNRRVELTIYY
jgi:outer membrane protein OmpA-like peptidoglycan-associated protein